METTPLSTSNELENCPFCGNGFKIYNSDFGGFWVDHPFPKCPVHQDEWSHSVWETKEKLIYSINSRSGVVKDKTNLSTPEPQPEINNHPAVWDLVIQFMKERDEFGFTKYGTRLQPFNGRDPMVDALQEILDLVVYLTQHIYELTNVESISIEKFDEILSKLIIECQNNDINSCINTLDYSNMLSHEYKKLKELKGKHFHGNV